MGASALHSSVSNIFIPLMQTTLIHLVPSNSSSLILYKATHPVPTYILSSCTKQLISSLILYQVTHILTHPVPRNLSSLILYQATHSLTLPVPSNSYILTHPVPAYSCSLILHQTPHLSCEIWTVDSQHAKKKIKKTSPFAPGLRKPLSIKWQDKVTDVIVLSRAGRDKYPCNAVQVSVHKGWPYCLYDRQASPQKNFLWWAGFG